MFPLQLQLVGDTDLMIGFTLLEAEFSNWSEQFEKLEPESTIAIQRVFEQEGPGWLALRPATAAYKAKRFPGKTILRRTDRGYLSFVSGNEGNVVRIAPLSAEFGSNVPYLSFHQETRPIIRITEQDEQHFLEIVLTDKAERIRELGFGVN